jgi:acyl carrier protein
MINERLRDLLAEMLDMPSNDITLETRREDVATWDSLNHLQLVTALESEFGVALTMEEIAAIKTVDDLQRIVSAQVTLDA